MSRHTTWAFFASSCTLLTLACYAPTTHAGGWGVFTPPTTNMEKLACHIDKLEKHIDEYGSVVAKAPDVWGEERLTQHRFEYETILSSELTKFQPKINANVLRSDEAFLATAISVAASMDAAPQVRSRAFLGSSNADIVTTETSQSASTVAGFAEKAFSTSLENVSENDLQATNLEPTIHLDQLSRYINHLHELRRINEGDDIAANPGYQLGLLRVPVSINPGKVTREGYGAEITFTVTPQIGDAMLNTYFETLVVNDLTDSFGGLLNDVLNQPGLYKENQETGITGSDLAILVYRGILDAGINLGESEWYFDSTLTSETVTEVFTAIHNIVKSDKKYAKLVPLFAQAVKEATGQVAKQEFNAVIQVFSLMREQTASVTATEQTAPSGNFASQLFSLFAKQVLISSGSSAGRSDDIPMPMSDFSTVYGPTSLLFVAVEAEARIERHQVFAHDKKGLVLPQDIQRYVREELSGAYSLLKRPEASILWQACGTELAAAIRTHNRPKIEELRKNFFTNCASILGMPMHTGSEMITAIYAWAIICEAAFLNERLIEDMRTLTSTKGCCCLGPGDWHAFYLPNPDPVACEVFRQYVSCRWPIHVFHVDPQEQQQNVNDSFTGSRELQLSLAIALSQGRISFSQASQFARRIQLEVDTIALNKTAVGFTHGSDTFGFRFYPRVQTPDIESNIRVGMRDLLIGGPSKDALLKNHRIEPGPRECIALVVVPGFMRQMTVDVHSEWFQLTNPKHTVMSTKETVRLSKDITTLRELSTNCVKDQHLYRDGEVYRLMKRVDQLDHELPLQTMTTEMPVAEPLGGFRVVVPSGNFNRAPQLFSWNGVPGVDTTKSTSLFLVGENFRLRGTQVIAGNTLLSPNQTSTVAQAKRDLADTESKEKAEAAQAKVDAEEKNNPPGNTLDDLAVRLISDTILQVTIPKDAHTFQKTLPSGATGTFIDIHVASYYGVSQHLHIPVIKTAESVASEAAMNAVKKAVKEEVATANQGLLQDMGMNYQWLANYVLEANYEHKTNQVTLLNSTPDSLGVVRKGEQIVLFAEDKVEIAFFITGLTPDGKPIPNQIARINPRILTSTPDPFNSPGNTILELSKAALNQIVTEALTQNAFAEVPPAVQLQAFIRFKSDGAPVIKLNNPMIVKLMKAQSTPTATQNGAFLNPEENPFVSPRPTLADRYRTPQQATITPPLIAQ